MLSLLHKRRSVATKASSDVAMPKVAVYRRFWGRQWFKKNKATIINVQPAQPLTVQRQSIVTSADRDLASNSGDNIKSIQRFKQQFRELFGNTDLERRGNLPVGPTEVTSTILKSTHNTLSVYMKQCYCLMYYVGISSHGTLLETKNRCRFILFAQRLQKIGFWMITILSLFQSICQAKYSFFDFLSGKEHSSFVDWSFYLICLITKAYALQLFYFKRVETTKMVTMIAEYDSISKHPVTDYIGTISPEKLKLFTAATIFLACARSINASGLSNWSMKSSVLFNSNVIVEDVFIWSTNNSLAIQYSDKIEHEYAANHTILPTMLAMTNVLRNIASHMQLGIVQDLIVVVALVMHSLVFSFIRQMWQTMENATVTDERATKRLQKKRVKIWKQYKHLKTVIAAINDVYDPILKPIHVSNLLMYAYFLTACILKPTTVPFAIILYAVSLLKAELSYYIAGKIAEQNDVIRSWLRNWALRSGKIVVDDEEMDINVLLDELDKEPIGLGKGNFLIQHTFHFKFLGLVGSTFFSLADEYKDSMHCDNN